MSCEMLGNNSSSNSVVFLSSIEAFMAELVFTEPDPSLNVD